MVSADGRERNGPAAYNCAPVVKMGGTRSRSRSGGDKQNMVSRWIYVRSRGARDSKQNVGTRMIQWELATSIHISRFSHHCLCRMGPGVHGEEEGKRVKMHWQSGQCDVCRGSSSFLNCFRNRLF